jgi:hypothetical protein
MYTESTKFSYLCERFTELFEEDYGKDIPISHFNLDKKAIKDLKKNPMLLSTYKKATTGKAQQLKAECIYGDWSFDINNLRGIGTLDTSKEPTDGFSHYIVNRIGTHEWYNKAKNQR